MVCCQSMRIRFRQLEIEYRSHKILLKSRRTKNEYSVRNYYIFESHKKIRQAHNDF
jgi:hypothetical protein